jgi:hypothetical protein
MASRVHCDLTRLAQETYTKIVRGFSFSRLLGEPFLTVRDVALRGFMLLAVTAFAEGNQIVELVVS